MSQTKQTIFAYLQNIIRVTVLLLVIALILTVAPTLSRLPAAGAVQPAAAVREAAVVHAQAAVSFELCAKAGTITMPDGLVVNVWGYALKPATLPCSDSSVAPQVPGPVLQMNEGDSVTITLYNELSESSSALFPGQATPPDGLGTTSGSSVTYSFTAGNPGTFLYESGINSQIQVPMGLYGAFVVHSATSGRAYGQATSAYEQQAVLVLSEIDPKLNNAANPNDFNMLEYAPTYWLINGKAYPNTDAISASAGDRVLLRYLNAGLTHHTMTLLGTHQQLIAMDAFETGNPYSVVAQTIPAGQTADLIATIPASAAGDNLPLYNRQLHLTNGGLGPDHFLPGGGMMTFIEVSP